MLIFFSYFTLLRPDISWPRYVSSLFISPSAQDQAPQCLQHCDNQHSTLVVPPQNPVLFYSFSAAYLNLCACSYATCLSFTQCWEAPQPIPPRISEPLSFLSHRFQYCRHEGCFRRCEGHGCRKSGQRKVQELSRFHWRSCQERFCSMKLTSSSPSSTPYILRQFHLSSSNVTASVLLFFSYRSIC